MLMRSTDAVPSEIGALTLLETLVLSDNRLATLPDSIAALSGLRSLVLARNRMTALPAGLLALSLLERLDLAGPCGTQRHAAGTRATAAGLTAERSARARALRGQATGSRSCRTTWACR